jgi:hypothetical protein
MRNTTEETVATVVLGTRDIERGDREERKDDEREDPLQGNYLHSELSQSQSWM